MLRSVSRLFPAAAAAAFTVALLVSPLVFAGGGDEGVDILPGLMGDGTLQSSSVTNHVAIANAHDVERCIVDPDGPGLVIANRSLADVVPSHFVPYGGNPALQVVGKYPRILSVADEEGSVVLSGRFLIEDHGDPADSDLHLRVDEKASGLLILIVGRRTTMSGGIRASFRDIRATMVQMVPLGTVDLDALRTQARQALPSGIGLHLGIGLIGLNSDRQLVESWAAFGLDDALPAYDVDSPH
jgi:hypothetical protein